MSSNEAFEALRAACDALGDVDVSGWDDTLLAGHLAELSAALCSLDSEVTRVAEDVRSRGFRVTEPDAAPVAAHGSGGVAEPSDSSVGSVASSASAGSGSPVGVGSGGSVGSATSGASDASGVGSGGEAADAARVESGPAVELVLRFAAPAAAAQVGEPAAA